MFGKFVWSGGWRSLISHWQGLIPISTYTFPMSFDKVLLYIVAFKLCNTTTTTHKINTSLFLLSKYKVFSNLLASNGANINIKGPVIVEWFKLTQNTHLLSYLYSSNLNSPDISFQPPLFRWNLWSKRLR